MRGAFHAAELRQFLKTTALTVDGAIAGDAECISRRLNLVEGFGAEFMANEQPIVEGTPKAPPVAPKTAAKPPAAAAAAKQATVAPASKPPAAAVAKAGAAAAVPAKGAAT